MIFGIILLWYEINPRIRACRIVLQGADTPPFVVGGCKAPSDKEPLYRRRSITCDHVESAAYVAGAGNGDV